MTIVLFCGAMLFGSTFLFFSEQNKNTFDVPDEYGANFSAGGGTQADPYLVYNADDLFQAISGAPEGTYFKQMVDIDFDGNPHPWPTCQFVNITYDGNGYSVSNIFFQVYCLPFNSFMFTQKFSLFIAFE